MNIRCETARPGGDGAISEAMPEHTDLTVLLRSLRGVWDEVAVDELDHALQSAARALDDGAAKQPGADAVSVAEVLALARRVHTARESGRGRAP